MCVKIIKSCVRNGNFEAVIVFSFAIQTINPVKKYLVFLVLLLIAFIIGWLFSQYYNPLNALKPKHHIEEESTVLLEKIQTVCKLVTVEGEFADIYSYKDDVYYDFDLFSKKALLKVKAKVGVGYDLTKATFKAKPEERVIFITGLPEPEVLYVDSKVAYYDLQQGTFNSFSPQDLTRLNEKARNHIEKQANSSELKKRAQAEGENILDIIKFMVESSGWTVVVGSDQLIPPMDSTLKFPD